MASTDRDEAELRFSEAIRALLDRYGFDADTWTGLRRRYAADPAGFSNTVKGRLELPVDDDITALPPPGSAEFARLSRLGSEAVSAGQVAAVVLAGGMATRFGGAVKAAVEVTHGRSFLDLKLGDIAATARACDARMDVFVMTSFATDDHVRGLLAECAIDGVRARAFAQFVSVRVREDGGVFVEADGQPSLYAPGHGDLSFALRRSGLLADFRAAGGRYLMVSNVDNLAAVCEPALIGAHIEGGRDISVEVVAKHPGDKGGAPARLDGKVQVIEEFRFPPGFDQDAIPVFNTNTFVMNAAALERDFPLDWFAARKSVDGRTAIQFERLMGQLTGFLPARFARVPRGGAAGRFLPVKDPDELARRLPEIRAVLSGRGVLPP